MNLQYLLRIRVLDQAAEMEWTAKGGVTAVALVDLELLSILGPIEWQEGIWFLLNVPTEFRVHMQQTQTFAAIYQARVGDFMHRGVPWVIVPTCRNLFV